MGGSLVRPQLARLRSKSRGLPLTANEHRIQQAGHHEKVDIILWRRALLPHFGVLCPDNHKPWMSLPCVCASRSCIAWRGIPTSSTFPLATLNHANFPLFAHYLISPPWGKICCRRMPPSTNAYLLTAGLPWHVRGISPCSFTRSPYSQLHTPYAVYTAIVSTALPPPLLYYADSEINETQESNRLRCCVGCAFKVMSPTVAYCLWGGNLELNSTYSVS